MSSKFIQVFDSLPPEGQRSLIEKHLVNLLDLVPKEKTQKILQAATQLQRKCINAPKLDLRAKRKQVELLLDELTRDAKLSFIKERSNREELLAEIVHTLVAWIRDVWTVVYEHRISFCLAHACLIYIADSLIQLSGNSSLGGCKCAVMNLPINLELKDKQNRVVKHFSVTGPQNLDRVLLWVWRDLFVTLLADGLDADKKKVPQFLEDIESSLGTHSLERLLYGGKKNDDGLDGSDWDEESDDEDIFDHDFFCDDDICAEDDNDSDYYTDESSDRCACIFHARYWPERLDRERLTLREHVEKHLYSVFAVLPSLALYNTLMRLSHNTYKTEERVHEILSKIAGDTPNNLVAALDIHISNDDSHEIASLLNSYSYLLRPQDAATLQCAVAMLDEPEHRTRGIAILEKELTDSVRAINSMVRSCFAQIDDEANKKELQEILKLRNNAPERKARLEAWGEQVITASNGPLHPMAFAAMMMGLPMMPGGDLDDDADMLSYVDFDQDDPDLVDLRDEYRPNLKAIFDGWHHLGQTLTGGSVVLTRVYVKALENMPWLRSGDVVTEMANRLRERPSKGYVLDALLNLSSFAKLQRKKISLARSEMQRRNNGAKMNTTAPKATAQPSSSSTLRANAPNFVSAITPTSPAPHAPASSNAPSTQSGPPTHSTPPIAPSTFHGPTESRVTSPVVPTRSSHRPPGGMEDVD